MVLQLCNLNVGHIKIVHRGITVQRSKIDDYKVFYLIEDAKDCGKSKTFFPVQRGI